MGHDLATLTEAIADAYPRRDAIVWRAQRLTWEALSARTRRLAAFLRANGVGSRPSHTREPWESPHAHVALYLHNHPAYLEGMLGAHKAGAAAFNVNYRYVADELTYVLRDAGTAAIVYQASFAAVLAPVLPTLEHQPLLLQLDDGTGTPLLPGAIDYDAALASADPTVALGPWSGDDRYLLYTGGTTGNPKGVVWRQDDFLVGALGFLRRDGTPFESVAEIVERAAHGARLRTLPAPPFMHGAAHWNALSTLLAGGTVVIQERTDRFDASDICATIDREAVSSVLIVGDAFARPLLDHLATADTELATLRFVLSGGAILSPTVKAELLDRLPQVQIVDVLGSSESGRQGVARSHGTSGAAPTRFVADSQAVVLSPDRDRVLAPGDESVGWLAQSGPVPLAYLGDPAKTAATFPTIDGVRYSVPGDRARIGSDGSIELLGREAATINTGGEKVFAEEVEAALKAHPDILDVLVVGRPSERWGSEVVAVASLRAHATALPSEVVAVAAAHLARYKLPKAGVAVPAVRRSPSGKPDYAWAREIAVAALGDATASLANWHHPDARS